METDLWYLKMRWNMRVTIVSFVFLIVLSACASVPKYLVKGMHQNASKSTPEDARYLAVVDALCHVAEYEGEQNTVEFTGKLMIETKWKKENVTLHQVMTFTKKYKLLSTRIEIAENGTPLCRIENSRLIVSTVSWKAILEKTGFKLRQFRNDEDTLIAELVKE